MYSKHFNDSIAHPEAFWMEQAKQIDWHTPPQIALTTDEEGLQRWFPDGILNTCHLAIDYHVENGRADQLALIYDSPVTNTIVKYTYAQLQQEVMQLAGGLESLGLAKGDTVIIYMPMIPQAAMAMLACARLGVIHSVVFGGFAPHELTIRIDDAKPKAIITATSGIEINKIVPYKPMVDKAIAGAKYPPQHVVVFDRKLGAERTVQPIDIDFETLKNTAKPAGCVPVKATDSLYILYTSGTTGKPKGIIRDNGGHAVALKYSLSAVYGLAPGEVFWAASDVGWVVGHSYIVYGPLLHGATTVLFEGKPIKTPDASTFWRVIQEHKVNVMFTAPTAIRAIKNEDPEGAFIKQHDLSSLRYQFLAGERCDAATLRWLEAQLQRPVIDHWWQTESGWPMLANSMGIEPVPVKEGSATFPVAGYNLHILREDGTPSDFEEPGYVAIKLPLPPGCLPTLWGDNERFRRGYLQKFPGYYFSGDGGYRDSEGYVYITGRVDDIINVAGHRLSTAEMEEVVAAHSAIAECAVVGISDELKGQIPAAFVVLKTGYSGSVGTVVTEVVQAVREHIGPVAALKTVIPLARLPKTRSGKILRKTLRAIVDGDPYTIPSTIDDPSVLDEIATLLGKK
ncbi:MAG: AMP-binding protein [Schleiferiaceae bacterium]|nr:AMP-binding protein [Schleiferiaceae bacterium]